MKNEINEILVKLGLREKSTEEVELIETQDEVVETPVDETVVATEEVEKSEVEVDVAEKMDEVPAEEVPAEEVPEDEAPAEDEGLTQLKELLAELALVVESMGETQKELTEKMDKLSKSPATVKAETKIEKGSSLSVNDRIKNFRKEFSK